MDAQTHLRVLTPALRDGELGDTPPPRSNRVFPLDGLESGRRWGFKTREGAIIGEYDSPRAASAGVADFVEFLVNAPPSLKRRYLNYLNRQHLAQNLASAG